MVYFEHIEIQGSSFRLKIMAWAICRQGDTPG